MNTNIEHVYKFTIGKQTYIASDDNWMVMKKFMDTIEKEYLQNIKQVNKS